MTQNPPFSPRLTIARMSWSGTLEERIAMICATETSKAGAVAVLIFAVIISVGIERTIRKSVRGEQRPTANISVKTKCAINPVHERQGALDGALRASCCRTRSQEAHGTCGRNQSSIVGERETGKDYPACWAFGVIILDVLRFAF
jgi:hypothetical protein